MKALVLMICIIAAVTVGAEPRRRALLIGIDDYTATTMTMRARHATPPGRDWPDLTGAVNDVHILSEMLVLLYGFDRGDIVTLTDQAATREAILESTERHLAAPAAKDDVLFFYYAGHGSQVRNSRSDERDRLDESIVPADSRLGAPDIRDKELRRLFNRMLDRGARLTIMLDSCNSGSGARGLPTGAQPRGVKADLRDLRDATDYGPLPERRGALVLSATQDFDRAWEKRDAEGKPHGVFSWAWIRALRDAVAGESAMDTYLRADARIRAETPYQEPVIAGLPSAQSAPFLGVRTDRRDDRTVVAVERVSGGTVILQGGWANGLSIGTKLRDPETTARIVVTAMRGLGRSEARVEGSSYAIHSGMLMEVVAWAPPPGQPLRVSMPRMPGGTAETMKALARRLEAAASKGGLKWVSDPTELTPAHLLRWSNDAWELVTPEGVQRLGTNPVDAIAKIARGSSLFVQFPPPAGVATEGVAVVVARPEDADYVLAGRYVSGTLSYAWVRPAMRRADRRRSGLPVRTAWVRSATALHEAVLGLRRIHAWLVLESPPRTPSPCRLALRRNGAFVEDGTLLGDQQYELVLRAIEPAQRPRYVYVFVIDSDGAGTLLYPLDGSVENRFSVAESVLGSFAVAPPYGIDTYVLLTTEEPLPSPWILTWEGVRGELQATTAPWSIERLFFESVPPRRH
jgi:hypothetical protein